ncbi:MAG: molybdopterin molybdotransferase MoeA [Myxococcaceae bacterium]
MKVGRLERAGLLEAHGRFLADAVFARRPAPALDLSAMDGFAVLARDTVGAKATAPRPLKVVGEVFAGQPPPKRDLQSGEAMRIYTGAALPYGADAVVRQESITEGEQSVAVLVEAKPGDNVRARGEEWREGERLLEPGTRIDAGVLAVLASMGLVTVPVRASPRLSIITQGDELVEPGARIEPHQVYDSNRVMLAAMAADTGAHLVGEERVKDDDRALAETLERLSAETDVVVTCGGASVGKKDRVKWVLETLGAETIFDGVAMRPGKPVGLFSLGPAVVAVLPGNPLAAAVTFDQLVRPLLYKRQGVLEARRVLTVPIDRDVAKPAGMRQFIPRNERVRGGPTMPLVGASGWLVLPDAPSHVSQGREVPFELFADPRHVPASDEAATSA